MAKGGALLIELVAVFTAAAGIGVPLARFRMPPSLGYLAVGVVLGPQVTGFVESQEMVTELAEIGVALLLLGIGLEFGTDKLRRLARPMAVAGGVQLIGTLSVGFLVGLAVGLSPAAAFALGGVVALSSTAIGLRLLQERGGTGSAEGVAVTGVLVLQDIAVVPLVLIVEALGSGGTAVGIAWAIARAALTLAGVWLVARLLAHRVLDAVAKLASQELFLLAVLAIAGLVALACSLVGLSPALGAFLAGVVLADGQFAHRATREILPLRSVTACIFFASVGMLFDPATIWNAPGLVAGSLVAIVLGKASIAALGGRLSGLGWSASARAGVLLGQIGEFSFVLAGVAATVGLFDATWVGTLTALTIMSMALTAGIGPFLGRPRRQAAGLGDDTLPDRVDVVVAGAGVGGSAAARAAEEAGRSVVIVERNPETVATLRAAGRPAVHGDAAVPGTLGKAGMHDDGTLVIAVSDLSAAYAAARSARTHWPDARILLRVRYEEDAQVDLPDDVELICEETEGARALAVRLGAPRPP